MKTIQSILPGISYQEPENSKEWFGLNTPWCPLFGYLPLYGLWGPQDEVESPVRNACFEIIDNARSLWDLHTNDKLFSPFEPQLRSGWTHLSWPEENDLIYPAKKLTLEKLKSARIIFKGLDAMKTDSLFIQLKDPRRHTYMDYQNETIRGVFEEVRSRVIAIARNRMDISKEKIDRTVRDSKILAIFTIWISWRLLGAMLLEDIREDKPWIQRQMRIAQFFMEDCSYRERDEITSDHKKVIQRLKLPAKKYEEHIKRTTKGRVKGTKVNIAKGDAKAEAYLNQADIIRKEGWNGPDKELHYKIESRFRKMGELYRQLEYYPGKRIEIEEKIEIERRRSPIYEDLERLHSKRLVCLRQFQRYQEKHLKKK